MTLLAMPEIHLCAFVERFAVTDPGRGGGKPRQARHIGGHIRDCLGVGQVVPVGEVLHALVPALVVAKIGQLLQQYTAVLTGDRGDFAVAGPAALRAVAGGAGGKQVRATREIRLEPGSFGEFAVAQFARVRVLRRRLGGEQAETHHENTGGRAHALTLTRTAMRADRGYYLYDFAIRVRCVSGPESAASVAGHGAHAGSTGRHRVDVRQAAARGELL